MRVSSLSLARYICIVCITEVSYARRPPPSARPARAPRSRGARAARARGAGARRRRSWSPRRRRLGERGAWPRGRSLSGARRRGGERKPPAVDGRHGRRCSATRCPASAASSAPRRARGAADSSACARATATRPGCATARRRRQSSSRGRSARGSLIAGRATTDRRARARHGPRAPARPRVPGVAGPPATAPPTRGRAAAACSARYTRCSSSRSCIIRAVSSECNFFSSDHRGGAGGDGAPFRERTGARAWNACTAGDELAPEADAPPPRRPTCHP